MLSESIGPLLRATREDAGVSRAQLARRCGVSVRLLAEFERGERPHVSLETALTLLNAVGITVGLTTPAGESTALRSPATDAIARAARADYRRQHWKGAVATLHGTADDPGVGRTRAARVRAVASVSEAAYTVARAPRRSS